MRMRSIILALSIGVPAGIAAGLGACAWLGLPRPAMARPAGPPPPRSFAWRLSMGHRDNLGAPGHARFWATFEVGTPRRPDPARPDRADFLVVANVYDAGSGERVVADDVIGRGVDEAGVGHWSRRYGADYRLPPGAYHAVVQVVDPAREMIEADGSARPLEMGYTSRRLVVR